MQRKTKTPKVKIRKVWTINPSTRVKQSKKIYLRQKVKQQFQRIIKNGQINTEEEK